MLLFTDLYFWLIFVLFLTVYAKVRQCSRVAMLVYVVAFSIFFYSMSSGWYVLLLLGVALFSWLAAEKLRPSADAELADSARMTMQRKVLLAIVIIVLLLPLLYLKYTNFFLSTLNALARSNFSVLSLALPAGISFFTFQSISYVVDVCRGKFTLKASLLEYVFYLTFFPLIMAGPITRAHTLIPQLKDNRAVPLRTLYLGLWLVMLGLVKKCVIADYLAQYNDWVFDDAMAYSGFECMMAILGYASQIYCDFSGYSDLSIGIADMMGMRLSDNFSFPYRARNLSDFWRRWHISLSSWFRDYLYIPLGGNRCSRARTYYNNIITMLVAGLWHGASMSFVLWGAIHGVGLVIYKLCRPVTAKLPDNVVMRLLGIFITFVYVAVAWVFFRSDSMSAACTLLSHAVMGFDDAYLLPFVQVRPWWTALMLLPLAMQYVSDKGFRRMQARYICMPWIFKLVLLLIVVQLVMQFRTSSVQPFIYYQF